MSHWLKYTKEESKIHGLLMPLSPNETPDQHENILKFTDTQTAARHLTWNTSAEAFFPLTSRKHSIFACKLHSEMRRSSMTKHGERNEHACIVDHNLIYSFHKTHRRGQKFNSLISWKCVFCFCRFLGQIFGESAFKRTLGHKTYSKASGSFGECIRWMKLSDGSFSEGFQAWKVNEEEFERGRRVLRALKIDLHGFFSR